MYGERIAEGSETQVAKRDPETNRQAWRLKNKRTGAAAENKRDDLRAKNEQLRALSKEWFTGEKYPAKFGLRTTNHGHKRPCRPRQRRTTPARAARQVRCYRATESLAGHRLGANPAPSAGHDGQTMTPGVMVIEGTAASGTRFTTRSWIITLTCLPDPAVRWSRS